MDAKKFVVAGVLGGIALFMVSFIVGMLVQMALPYDVLSLGGMRAADDPMMGLFFLSPWVMSFTMALVYPYVKGSLQGTIGRKGTKFGLLMWVVASIPSAFIVYTSMTYPLGFTVDSVIGTLLYMLAAGIVIARVME